MTTQWITECPHCGTSFRVTEQHLRAAKGSVRCGSCLQIFNAIDTLFPGEEAVTASDTTTPIYTPIITPSSDTPEPTSVAQDTTDVYELPDSRQQWENDQVQEDQTLADNPIANELAAFINSRESWPDHNDYLADFDTSAITTPELDTPFIDTPLLDETFLEATANARWDYEHESDDVDLDKFDEKTAHEEIINEEDSTAPYEEPFTETIDTHFDDVHVPDNMESPFESDDVVNPNTDDTHDESISPTTTQRLYGEDILLADDSHIPNQYELRSENVWQSDQDEEHEPSWQTIHEEQEPHIGPYREPFRDALLNELEAEPPRGFQWHEADTPLSRKIVWWGLSFFLVLTLGIQYVIFNYADFAATLQKPPFNGWMHALCKTVSCRFIRTDVSLVTSENLIIRTHPTQAGVLVVDTMLYNHAAYEQPFPLLDLSFSDMSNKLIAQRIFRPAEYLSGDLANVTDMPVNTPLHISFAIKNPGESATNYRLKILANTR